MESLRTQVPLTQVVGLHVTVSVVTDYYWSVADEAWVVTATTLMTSDPFDWGCSQDLAFSEPVLGELVIEAY